MTLTDFLKKTTQQALASQLGVTQGLVSQWVRGETQITAERALEIEAATGGQVTRQELRPDIFGIAA